MWWGCLRLLGRTHGARSVQLVWVLKYVVLTCAQLELVLVSLVLVRSAWRVLSERMMAEEMRVSHLVARCVSAIHYQVHPENG
jgi:hypothetical protein